MEKIYNLRDVGGHRTADGRLFQTGMLYRSDDPSRATQSDLARLRDLNLRLICDLRSPEEIKRPSPPGFRVVNIPLHDHAKLGVGRWQGFGFLLRREGGERFLEFSRSYYQHIAFERLPQIGQILTLLAEPGNFPALIHCRAGKDRTGVIVALLQLLAGVPFETVMQDYLYTNESIRPRIEQMIRTTRLLTLFQVSPERMRLLAAAKPEYLEGVYSEVVRRYGTAEEFLRRGCGVEAEVLARLKDKLLSA